MQPYRTQATVGVDGNLVVEGVPFRPGDTLRVVLAAVEPKKPLQTRVFDLHAGGCWMSDDFDAPLPDAFWLAEESGEQETSV